MNEMRRLLELAGLNSIQIKNVGDDNKKDSLVKLLRDNPTPSNEELKQFDPSFLASMLGSLLKKFKHVNDDDSSFDKEQLEKGIKIEHEHTNDSYLAKIIAKAHLAEIPDYYDRLEKMEKEAEGTNSEKERKNDANTAA
jgi:hypothetical protein